MAREISISFALTAALTGGFKGVFQSAASSARNVASAIRDMEKSPVGYLGAAMAREREKISGLAGSLKEARSTLVSLQSQASQASAPFLALNAKFEQAKERTQGLVANLKNARNNLDNLKKQALASAASMNGFKAQVAEARGKVVELSAGLKDEKAALAALRAQKKAVGDSTGVLSVQIAQAENRIASLSGKLGAARANLAGLREKEQAAAAATNSLKAQSISAKDAVARLSASLKEEKSSLAALKSQAAIAASSLDYLKSEVSQAENRVKSLSGTLATQLTSWRENVAQATAVSGSVHKLTGEYERLAQKMERANKINAAINANRAQSEALRAQRADLNGRLAGTVATTATMALPVKLAISAEDTFADLRKVMDGASEEMLAQTFSDAQAMSNRTGKSFEDIVTIMAAAAQSGLGKTREEMLSVADQAVKMSIAWGVSAETAGQSLANWRTSMGLTEEQSKHTANVINALSNSMAAEAGDINDIFTRMGAMMKSSGMATQDIAALATAFKSAGAQVEVSGTAMKNFTNVLAAGSAGMTPAKLSVFKYLEIDPDELQKQFYHDAKGAILRVLDALKNNVRPEELNSIAGAAFGQDSIAAISPLIEQIDTLRKAFKIANSDVAGSVDDEYANRMKTTATAIGQATQSMRNLGVTAGKALLPAVGFVAQGISGLVSIVDGAVKRFPNFSSGVMMAGASVAALAAGSLALGLVLNTVKTVLNGLRGGLLRVSAAHMAATAGTAASTAAAGAFGAASGLAGVGARFFAGGLRSIMMATGVGALLVGLGYGISLLIDNWGAVSAAMSSAWGQVTDTWSRLGVFFSELGGNLAPIFAPVWNSIASGASAAWNWITGAASWAWNGITGIWNGVTGFFSGLWNGVASGATAVWNWITAGATWAWNGIAGIWNGATAFFSGIVNSIFGVFTGLFNWLKEKFSWVFSTIDAISGFVGKVVGAVKGAWNTAQNASAAANAENARNRNAAPNAVASSSQDQSAAKAAIRALASVPPAMPQTAQAAPGIAGANALVPKPTAAPNAQAAMSQDARPSYGQWLKDQEAAKKAAGSSGGRKKSGASNAVSAPVTVVTLDGGNKIRTQYFSAPGAAPNAARAQEKADRGILSSAGSALKTSVIAGVMGQGLQAGFGLAKGFFGMGGKEGQSAAQAAQAAQSGRMAATTLLTPGRPALPQAPALIAKAQKRKARKAQAQNQAISIDLTQNFDLITQDAAAARKVLEAIKPDMEALIRRALEKMQSDKRRTAYAQ